MEGCISNIKISIGYVIYTSVGHLSLGSTRKLGRYAVPTRHTITARQLAPHRGSPGRLPVRLCRNQAPYVLHFLRQPLH